MYFICLKHKKEGKHVYVVQSLCPPINDNVIELLLIVSALKRANA